MRQYVVNLGAYANLLFPCVHALKIAADEHFDCELNALLVQLNYFWDDDVVAPEHLL